MKRKLLSFVLAIVMMGAIPLSSVFATSPDDLGPWADTVITAEQGLKKNGEAVLPGRSDPASALGVAENDTVEGHFYSLGFGGKLTLGFENGISSGSFIVEATNVPYPLENAQVEISEDGVNYFVAGTVTRDGSVPLPNEVSCGKFVRITDMSDKNLFEATADGFDVDGVRAEGLSCSTSGKMTGGGSIFTADEKRVTHGFQLRCNTQNAPHNLQINWGKGNKFHLESLTSAFCTDDPAIMQGHPKATFDTYMGSGLGRMNGMSGYTAEWVFVDAGEPGKNDTAKIVIKDPSNVVVLQAEGNLKNGNQQAHN